MEIIFPCINGCILICRNLYTISSKVVCSTFSSPNSGKTPEIYLLNVELGEAIITLLEFIFDSIPI